MAQRDLARSEILEDEIAVLAVGDGDALGRSSIGVDAAIRRLHTNLARASVADMRRMLQAARAPQAVMDALARFSCEQCDAMTQPKIPGGVSVPLTVAPLRDDAMDVKRRPSWEGNRQCKQSEGLVPGFRK